MTNSDPAPSSIRDDSICEPSLNPNKSSGDIGERTHAPTNDADLLMWCTACPSESAAEIERLRRERDEAVKREQYAIRWANASVDSVKEVVDVELADLKSERDRIARNRDMWKGQVDRQADRIRRLQPNALTAESAVAAAWGEAAKIVEVPCQFETRMVNGEILVSLVELQRIIHDRASAIRAAGAGKTAESGDSHSKCRRKNLDERGIGTE